MNGNSFSFGRGLMNRHVILLGAAVAAAGLCFSSAGAQEEAAGSVNWGMEAEAGASIFFGASDQTTANLALGVVRKSSHWESDNALAYLYGEATDELGNTSVTKRSWGLVSHLNYRAFKRVNPYAFASAESSYEKKIDLRLKGGTGAKLTARNSETTRLDFALAILAEQTYKNTEDDGDGELLARWTGAFNLRRSFAGERTIFEAKANYNPVFAQLANYTVDAETSLAFKLSEIISLKLSVVDKYDSRAKDRGARDNNDGQVLFSVLASF
jgi:hypothetical protein